MKIIINDKSCDASIGQTLSKVARLSHSHVGYLCGAHGVCQTCQVLILEGMACLSSLSAVEEAFLTERQIASGVRMACRTTIIRDGVLRILSRPEAVRRMLFTNPLPLFEYGAEIGNGVLSQAIPGLGNLVGRIAKGDIFNEDELDEFKDSVDGLIGLAVETLPEYLPFREQVMGLLNTLPLPPEIPGAELPITLPFLSTQTRKQSKKAVPIAYIPRKKGFQD